MPSTQTHLNLDDVPLTLALLAALLGHRSDRESLGYSPDEYGAEVDWDRLTSSVLSSTEKATVYIARGCAVAERHGSLPREVHGALRAVIEAITAGGAP